MKDIENKEDIKLLVDAFYKTVMENDLLSPIFDEAIKNWEAHLPRMYSFWGTLLIGEMSYKRSPYSFHENLPINKVHFDEWVRLFVEAVNQNFEGTVAEQAKNFAKTNGHIFESKMRMR